MKTAVLLAAATSASAAVYKTPLKKVSLSDQLVSHRRIRTRKIAV
jgi:saccharopepsin